MVYTKKEQFVIISRKINGGVIMSKDKILLIGGIDSIGVPYTRDNKTRINHLKVVRDFLTTYFRDVEMIDMYCMNKYNTTEYIHELLSKGYNLNTIRKNQRESIDLCRKNGIFQFIQLPANMKEYYEENGDEKTIVIRDEIKNNDTIFVYTCGANDFLARMETNLGKLIFPKYMDEALIGIEETIAEVVDKIKQNIEELRKLNNNIEIYILGIYIPTKFKYIRTKTTYPIEAFNEALKTACLEYENTYYIDNSNLTIDEMASVDWHPNQKGQQMIGENIVKEIKTYSKILRIQTEIKK